MCSNANYKVVVKGVKLADFIPAGTYAFPAENTSEISAEAMDKWTLSNAEKVNYTVSGDAVTLTAEAQSLTFDGGSFMVLPQQLTAWDGTQTNKAGSYISVLCQIYRVDGTNETMIYPTEEDKYAYAAVPVGTDLKMGNKYIYTLNFLDGEFGGAGQIDPNPGEGVEDGDDTVDTAPEVEGGAGEDGTIIAGTGIGFTVSVDEWNEINEAPAMQERPSVNLGLSVKWATMNIGANSPGEYGDYFYRGATKPYNSGEEGSSSVTIQTTLTADYDAATVNWGESWHIPTEEECNELINYCTWTKQTADESGYGVAGYLVTSNIDGFTDKSIFLPLAGCQYRDNYIIAYWTSTYRNGDVYMSDHSIIDNPLPDVATSNSTFGNFWASIRPVKK